MKTINAGAFRYKIKIFKVTPGKDDAGFANNEREYILTAHAQIKVTRGFTILVNNSDFEKAYTNFTIRKPVKPIVRNMKIEHGSKLYNIEYVNPLGVSGELLEMQAKEITK